MKKHWFERSSNAQKESNKTGPYSHHRTIPPNRPPQQSQLSNSTSHSHPTSTSNTNGTNGSSNGSTNGTTTSTNRNIMSSGFSIPRRQSLPSTSATLSSSPSSSFDLSAPISRKPKSKLNLLSPTMKSSIPRSRSGPPPSSSSSSSSQLLGPIPRSSPPKKRNLSMTASSVASVASSIPRSSPSSSNKKKMDMNAPIPRQKGSSPRLKLSSPSKKNLKRRSSSTTTTTTTSTINASSMSMNTSLYTPDISSSSSSSFHNSVKVVSEVPFRIQVNMSGVPFQYRGKKRLSRSKSNSNTSSSTLTTVEKRVRSSKRERTQKSYQDLKDTDSDFLTDSSQEEEMEDEDTTSTHRGKEKRKSLSTKSRSKKRMIMEKEFQQGPLGSGSNQSSSKPPPKKKTRLVRLSSGSGGGGGGGSSSSNPSSSTTTSLTPPPTKPKSKHLSSPEGTKKEPRASNISTTEQHATTTSSTRSTTAEDLVLNEDNAVEGPPSGVLPSLWYSREYLYNLYVVERILGFKTRPVVTLEYKEDSLTCTEQQQQQQQQQEGQQQKQAQPQQRLDVTKATEINEKLIAQNIVHHKERMECSRINFMNCPMVLKAYAGIEERKAKKRHSENNSSDYDTTTSTTPTSTTCHINIDPNEKEEVLLIKWRGKSFLHCSWERKRDLEKFDPTNLSVAKGKIKRYYQTQQMTNGKEWKKVLEDRRKDAINGGGNSHHHHHHGLSSSGVASPEKRNVQDDTGVEVDINDCNSQDMLAEGEEDYFPLDNLEVERIMACDESEMDMNVFSKQRALNLQADKEAVKQRRKEFNLVDISSKQQSEKENDVDDSPPEPWDVEDNVRYVVKWKGLQISEVTWEYWKFIKHDCVDQAEDFWFRQRPSDLEQVLIKENVHPSLQEYEKLKESPVFGVSSVPRPLAPIENDEKQIQSNGDDDDPANKLCLRSYQLEGVNWLIWNWWNKRSCILADEMGLGKTIQSMCFLDQLQRSVKTQIRGPFLIIAPLSLVNQWRSESTTWAPDMNVLLYHGNMDAREYLVKQEFYYTDPFVSKSTAAKLKRQHITKFDVLITTYEVAMKDISVLSKIKWKVMIVDEAHRLKNHQSRLFAELLNVPRDFCLLLTGTPLQNSTEELWSLLNFSDSSTFSSKDLFVEKFGQLSDAKQVSQLHSILKPYLLRRVKEDVEKSLPPKVETILEVSLTPIQKTYYKAIYEKNTSFLFKGSKPSNAPSLMNVMMELRKCCNHPFLIKGVEERIMADAAALEKSDQLDDPILRWQRLLADQLVQSSGKMVLLMKLLPKLQSGGHKVLIFSQMVKVLDLLEELLRHRKYKYERLDGSRGASSRAAAVDRFNKKSFQRFVMLLSTRAGGLGLNLVSADTVIIFDSDWNPQNDLQAMARAHRIGQTRAVRVYRLLTAKTYEMHMFHSASMKLGLDRAVLAHQRQQGEEELESNSRKGHKSKSEKETQAKEIDELLKKGAYDVFRDDDDAEAQKFMETDIDQLLERSSRTITYGNTNTSISSGLGSFSKASFVTSAEGKDIDLDDPNFWEKAVGIDAPVESSTDDNLLQDGEKRNRKQVQVFDPYASFHEAEQKKKDKIAQKLKQEREEKKKLKEMKRLQREEEKERKRKEREKEKEERANALAEAARKKELAAQRALKEKKAAKDLKELKAMKMKRAERKKKAKKKVVQQNPLLDRIKQAWEAPHRDRVIRSILRFGFGRFCKIRHEANLTSLPIQDIEVFARAYMFQLGIQCSFSLSQEHAIDIEKCVLILQSHFGDVDAEWIINAMLSSMAEYELIIKKEKDIRMPLILTETKFVSYLRSGVALASLRMLSFISRLQRIIEQSLDCILSEVGYEELGKRGCSTKDLSVLDTDLKARYVTVEELSHVIGLGLKGASKERKLSSWSPSPWWDRHCDIALIIGTFIHGLGNYENIEKDETLPFAQKIQCFGESETHSLDTFQNFVIAAKAVKEVFDDSLDAMRSKQQAETKKNAASTPPKVGKSSSTKDIPTEKNTTGLNSIGKSKIVSLLDLSQKIHHKLSCTSMNQKEPLPMPDSKALDLRLFQLIELIQPSESTTNPELTSDTRMKSKVLESNHIIADKVIEDLRINGLRQISLKDPFFRECPAINPSLGEASIYQTTSSSSLLAAVLNISEASKYHRDVGVPFVITRHSLAGIIYAHRNTIEKVKEIEKRRKTSSNENKASIKVVSSHESDASSLADIYAMDSIPQELVSNPCCRMGLCAAILTCGYPIRAADELPTNPCEEWNLKHLFSTADLLNTASEISGSKSSFSEEGAILYIDEILIPHCLRLCLFSNDCKRSIPTTKVDVCPKLDIIKVFTEDEKCLLPDPSFDLSEHSSGAVIFACALLRRVQLATFLHYLVGGKILPMSTIKHFLRSKEMRNNTYGVPMWWCPWVHDLALLEYASMFGILSIMRDRSLNYDRLSQAGISNALDHSKIKRHISNLMGDCKEEHEPKKSSQSLPNVVNGILTPSELEQFIEDQSLYFPTSDVLERRLIFICGSLSKMIKEDSNVQFRVFDFPIFD